MVSPRSVISPRSNALSPGAIAGAVIGSLAGGIILFLVLGFLYFRHKRMCRIAQAEDGLSESKSPDAFHPASLPWENSPSPQPGEMHDGLPGVEYGHPGGTVPGLKTESGPQMPPTPPPEGDQMNNSQAPTQQDDDHDAFPGDVNFSMTGRQKTFPMVAGKSDTKPSNHVPTAPEAAANSSYYDTRISMDSDPAGASITPPSRFMNEMYKAQLKEAEKHRRSNSLPMRIWNAVTRRQSTLQTNGPDRSGSEATRSLQFGENSLMYPVSIKQEPGQFYPGEMNWQGPPITSQFVAEPEEISEDAPSSGAYGAGFGRGGDYQSQFHHKISRGQTDDSQYGGFPYRIDSTIRETTERDPALPSSALNPDSTYGLPLEAQPHNPIEQRERLKSPEIPEPMDVDGLQPDANYSPFRSSYSPQLSPDSFTINPMDILHPTCPAEQAAYNNHLMNSVSAPPVPTPAPETNAQKLAHEDTTDALAPKGNDFADMYLDFPSDEENRRSSDSYEYPTTPRESESSGRTPDTQATVSPSPYPTISECGQSKPDPGISPSSSKRSPQPGPLVCPECGREFDQIHKLNHHKRYHDRTHECTFAGCNRKFGTKTHLDRHINDRHLKLKTYHCTEPTCAWFRGGKSFPRKDNWRRHMVKKHGTTPEEFDNMEPL